MEPTRKYTADQLPLTTSNAALAFALYLAGAPFADDRAPLINVYDSHMLRKMGYSGPIEKAVAEAFAKGRKGHVEFSFARVEVTALALGAFKQQPNNGSPLESIADVMGRFQGGRLALSEGIAAAVSIVLNTWREHLTAWQSRADFTRQRGKHVVGDFDAVEQAKTLFLSDQPLPFAALVVDAREPFLKLFRNYPPQIRLHRKGVPVSVSEGRTKYPGFAILGTGSVPDNDLRKHLGLVTR